MRESIALLPASLSAWFIWCLNRVLHLVIPNVAMVYVDKQPKVAKAKSVPHL